MNITFPALPNDGQVLARSHLLAMESAITAYSIPAADLAAPYVSVDMTIALGDIASGASRKFGLIVPAGKTYIPVAFDLYYATETSNPTASLTVTDDGANILNSALTTTVPAVAVTSNSFAITSIAASSQVIVTVAVSGGDITDASVTLHFKTTLRS